MFIRISILQVRTEAPITQAACENRRRQLVPVVQTKVVSTTRIPVSQRESLNDLAIQTVESVPTSACHLLASAIQISHSVSRDENKVSHSMSRNENIDVCSAWFRHRFCRVSVASHVPDHHSPLPAVCEKNMLLVVSIILWSVLRETS